jgi:hypothetical protein
MWYNKELDEHGEFQDKEGKRYMVTECHRIMSPDGRMNDELGYTEFSNMEECLKEWELIELK